MLTYRQFNLRVFVMLLPILLADSVQREQKNFLKKTIFADESLLEPTSTTTTSTTKLYYVYYKGSKLIQKYFHPQVVN